MQADPERLATVFGHLVPNTLAATEKVGRIAIEASITYGVANVSTSDTGKGKSPDFIRERTNRQFYSTNDKQSKVIGAYHAQGLHRDAGRRNGGHFEGGRWHDII